VTRQLRLELRRSIPLRRKDFVVSPTNAEAVRAIDGWRQWHAGALALVGPEGAGKTHLARIWAKEAGAVVVCRKTLATLDLATLEGRPVLFEDAGRPAEDELLFHLINMAGTDGGALLLTARTPPAEWPAALPDLRSRLNALNVAELPAPDDIILEGVLRKLFRERNIEPGDDLIAYLMRRIERSGPAARAIVDRLDEAAAEGEQRAVSRALARQFLEIDDETPDLFE
jgi:chromosomal replication initiation ATPase DnaA